MQERKPYMTGVYGDQHFIAEFKVQRQGYFCIPEHSSGNETNMDFFARKSQAKFHDTLEEAKLRQKRQLQINEALEEDAEIHRRYEEMCEREW